jgi:hypothetical protein
VPACLRACVRAAPAIAVPSTGGGGAGDLLGDLLGGPAPAPAPVMSVPAPGPAPPVAVPSAGGAFPQIVAYQGKGIQIRFDFAKAPSNESMTAINATIVTNQPSVTDFNMQVAVPKVRECMQSGLSQS